MCAFSCMSLPGYDAICDYCYYYSATPLGNYFPFQPEDNNNPSFVCISVWKNYVLCSNTLHVWNINIKTGKELLLVAESMRDHALYKPYVCCYYYVKGPCKDDTPWQSPRNSTADRQVSCSRFPVLSSTEGLLLTPKTWRGLKLANGYKPHNWTTCMVIVPSLLIFASHDAQISSVPRTRWKNLNIHLNKGNNLQVWTL